MEDESNEIVHTKKKLMIKTLSESRGIITKACIKSDISRSTHYKWYKEDLVYKNAVDDVEGIALDEVEEKLHDLIDGLNPTAVIFYLKCKGRSRGYIEKQEIDMKVEKKMDFSNWSDKDVDKFLALLEKNSQEKDEG